MKKYFAIILAVITVITITACGTATVNDTSPESSETAALEAVVDSDITAEEATGEFTVNVPSAKLAPAVDFCGVVSGRDEDKFAVRHLTPLKGSKISAPLVGECPIGLECRVTKKMALGSHTLFLAEILAVQVDSDLVDEKGRLDIDRAGLLAYAHGHYYEVGKCIGHFGFSVRKKPGPIVRK